MSACPHQKNDNMSPMKTVYYDPYRQFLGGGSEGKKYKGRQTSIGFSFRRALFLPSVTLEVKVLTNIVTLLHVH